MLRGFCLCDCDVGWGVCGCFPCLSFSFVFIFYGRFFNYLGFVFFCFWFGFMSSKEKCVSCLIIKLCVVCFMFWFLCVDLWVYCSRRG